jgi:ATP-dependent protease ClpP protease subunit
MKTIELHGVVGDDFTAASVSRALPASGPVRVLLNSGGGIAAEGAAIHAILSAHPGDIHVDVIGIAASAASLLAMAGKRITMRAGSVMMIHDPMNITVGNSADHAKTIEELEVYARASARVYAGRARISEAKAREIMVAETWYDGPQAVAAGFADAVDSAAAAPFASYGYDKYHHAARAMAVAQRVAAQSPAAAWARVIGRANGTYKSTPNAWSGLVEAQNEFTRRHRWAPRVRNSTPFQTPWRVRSRRF